MEKHKLLLLLVEAELSDRPVSGFSPEFLAQVGTELLDCRYTGINLNQLADHLREKISEEAV